EAAETLTHADFHELFENYVTGVNEIHWDAFFLRVGLRVAASEVTFAAPGFEASQNFDQPPGVVQVEAGSEAERAGLKPGDLIVQMNGQPTGRGFERTIAELDPGSPLRLRILRDGTQQDFPWTFITGDVRLLYAVAMWGASTGVRIAGVRVQTVGLDQLDGSRNYLFMCNHASNIDPPLLIPLIPGRTSVLVKKELFKVPIL